MTLKSYYLMIFNGIFDCSTIKLQKLLIKKLNVVTKNELILIKRTLNFFLFLSIGVT